MGPEILLQRKTNGGVRGGTKAPEWGTGTSSCAGDDIQNARREAGMEAELRHLQARHTGHLRGFEHDRVARSQSSRHLPLHTVPLRGSRSVVTIWEINLAGLPLLPVHYSFLIVTKTPVGTFALVGQLNGIPYLVRDLLSRSDRANRRPDCTAERRVYCTMLYTPASVCDQTVRLEDTD